MSRSNRLKLKPLIREEPNFIRPAKKEDRFFSQAISNQLPRFKTEGDQSGHSIFPLSLSVGRRNATSEKDPRKQYQLFRQLQLRSEFQNRGNYRRKRGVKLFKPTKEPAEVINKLTQKTESVEQVQEAKSDNMKDLQNNILHLANLFTVILKKGQSRELISAIKRYILQQQSDLGDVESRLNEQKIQQSIRQIIYYERMLLLLIVQSLITRKFTNNQTYLHQLCKDFILFYSLIYEELTGQSLATFLNQNNFKFISQYTSNLSSFSLFSIKDRISKRISFVAKPFPDIDKFILSEVSRLKSIPSNLLYYNLLQFYAARLVNGDWQGWGIEFLSTCPSPYLHHLPKSKYTLLLDLDQTLVHYRTINPSKGEFLLRPYLFQFLQKVDTLFEVGIFTCALKDYADIILQHCPTISIRFYRQHAVRIGQQLIKDLSRVGRDLSRVILVDNLEKNFKLQKQNGIHVKSWFGDPDDTVLKQLLAQLQSIIKNQPQDLRKSEHRRSFL